MSSCKALTAAARSNCPPGAAGFANPPALGFGAPPPGLDATGTGGLPPTLGGTLGLLATGGGGPGLGFGAGGGGFDAIELVGLELTGVLSVDEPLALEDNAACVFFQGAADPLAGIIPGNTATGFAEGSATTDFVAGFTAGAAATAGAAGAAGGRRAAGGGGGGGGAGAAFGFGGISSR